MKNFLFLILLVSALFQGKAAGFDTALKVPEKEFNLQKDSENPILPSFFDSLQSEFSDEGFNPGSNSYKGISSKKVFNFRDPENHLCSYLLRSKFIEPGLTIAQIIFPFHSIF